MRRCDAKKKDQGWAFCEQHSPTIVSLLAVIMYFIIDIEFKDSFETLLSASMSFASILIGFLGVLIALLFSLNNNLIRNYIFQNKMYKTKMHRYFQVPVISGFLFVILSFVMHLKKTIAGIGFLQDVIGFMQELLNAAWVFLLVFFITASYRLIGIVLRIAFAENVEEMVEVTKEEELNLEEYSRLQEEYAITEESSEKQE
ncbi:MAG: hypothetical protein E7260_10090 [Lachnospiraceae bacterium]|nr:hypothetical protein [Lachnospiraceae bacterium]